MSLSVSVVIPTYNRGALLARGLEGLARQTLPRDRFEVIVVDDGSTLPPDETAAPFLDRLPMRLLKKPNGGLASARNFGAAAATGDVLLFLDDDILPVPEFLVEHLAAHERDDAVAALGSLPHPDDLPVDSFLYYLNRVLHYDLFLRYGSAERIPLPPLNGNSSIRRRHFEAAGGYDTNFSSYGGEDTEMGYRLVRRGLRFVYAPRARGFHYHVKDFAAYERDMYSSGVTMVAIVRKYPEVRARVNLDIVAGSSAELGWSKRVKRALYLVLERHRALVAAMEALLRVGSTLRLKRALYPIYLVTAHFYYGLGMREEVARRPLAPAVGGE